MKIEEILSDKEKQNLQTFLENEDLKRAVKKVLLFGIYYSGTLKKGEEPDPTYNFTLALASNQSRSNEALGRDLRASAEGVRAVETGFKDLEKFRIIPQKEKEEKNPAI